MGVFHSTVMFIFQMGRPMEATAGLEETSGSRRYRTKQACTRSRGEES